MGNADRWLRGPRRAKEFDMKAAAHRAKRGSGDGAAGAPAALPTRTRHPTEPDAEVDETLIDLMLELTISDRLRTVGRYVTALGRFRRA